ncbi:MAG TPA: LysR family transcriptional regulator [Gemmatimonadaceae bacterium]|nr:LysR family transcriptional regulator [Gemmatimonadaceae bacterium]
MLDSRQLFGFVVLAEEMHFQRAARRLNVSQPGLSQRIRALERALGVDLLDRSRRRVQLTAAGTALLEEGRRALAQLARAEELARRAARETVAHVTLGAVQSAVLTVLPPLLREFGRRHQGAALTVRQMSSPAQIEALRRGEIDLAFVRTPVETGGLATAVLRTDRYVALLPEGHPLARRRTLRLAEVLAEPLVLHPTAMRPSWADGMLALCRAEGIEPRVAQEATESSVAPSFVAAGLGVTLVVESLARPPRPGVVARRLAAPAPTTRLLLVHRADESRAPVLALAALARRRAAGARGA